jgi:NAD(P)-dependent dehydrogenase (short-subunit alcohol dehydrogenase family)
MAGLLEGKVAVITGGAMGIGLATDVAELTLRGRERLNDWLRQRALVACWAVGWTLRPY